VRYAPAFFDLQLRFARKIALLSLAITAPVSECYDFYGVSSCLASHLDRSVNR
jgi:hypothetical protein